MNGMIIFKCTDIDECVDQCYGDHKVCENSIGSFSCSCKEGYNSEDAEGNVDGFVCVENDPCESSPCPSDASCKADGLLNYTCECNDNLFFKYDQTTNSCQAKSCEEAEKSEEFGCTGHHSFCSQQGNEPAECLCDSGFEKNADFIGDRCIDIDECNDPDHLECNAEGYTCTNTYGSYTCSCQQGYKLNSNDECVPNNLNNAPRRTDETENFDCEDEFNENEEDSLGSLDLEAVEDLADYDAPLKSSVDYN